MRLEIGVSFSQMPRMVKISKTEKKLPKFSSKRDETSDHIRN